MMATTNNAQSVDDLKAEIARLQAALSSEKTARTAAEETAMAMAVASPFTGGSEEQATGKTVKVKKCTNPWAKFDPKKDDYDKVYKFIEVDMPTYFYTLDLPAGAAGSNGASCLTTNGTEFYHGQTYEVTYDTLVDLKSRVARCWDHEKSIHGENENAYRRRNPQHLISAAAAQARGVH